ncbi:MAG: M14 family metallopeptidase [Saprospiraceae bacterium]
MKLPRPHAFFIFFFSAQAVFAQINTAPAISAGQGQAKTPNEFLPHQLGEQFTPHHLLNAYYEQLAAAAPTTMRLEKYGLSNEARPLQIAIFSSPENMARLEPIRLNNLRLAGMADGQPDLDTPIAIVWLSMSVHGNEPSGAECSMELAYRLATQTDAKVTEWLKNTVVILDPVLNPDGYDRYTHWSRMASNLVKNADPNAREHREPWPGGRANHYHFDLNRDWAWATQVESKQRLVVYHRWLPHVHPDVHEQGVNEPYYFAPAAEPMHELITQWQRDFQVEIGENNARHFDNNGWFYFTKEVFDLFYPSYGDTYPTFNGAIGMTYEQAGGPRGGLAIETDNGDTLTLHDRIAHHLTTSLATIEVSSKSAKPLVENFREYYRRTSTQPQGEYKTFIVREVNDPNKVRTLCQLLDQHHIRYGRVGAGISGAKAFDYGSGKEISASINPNDLVISAYQPHSVMVQALFEPEAKLGDSMTYDITAWSLPFAHGLEVYALKERLEPKRFYETYRPQKDLATASPYAWCVHRRSLAEAQFLGELLQKGVRVRTATEPFTLAEQQYAAGAFVVTKADNRAMLGELDGIVTMAAERANVRLYPVFTGHATKGKDLGSDAFQLVKKPSIALVYGDDVERNSYGHTWFFFERELGYPVSPIPLEKLNKMDLSKYTTLVFPDGSYSLEEKTLEIIKKWTGNGGRLIAFEGGAKAFADKDGFDLKTKEAPKRDSTAQKKPFAMRQRDGLSDGIPGAIVRAAVDNSHPLAFGFPDYYHSLKTLSDAYQMPEKADVPLYLEETFQTYGFIGSRVKPQLKKTPIVLVQKMGDGEAVLFVDNPLFRSFWQQGKMLFANALFF